jgi:hypothetical protein
LVRRRKSGTLTKLKRVKFLPWFGFGWKRAIERLPNFVSMFTELLRRDESGKGAEDTTSTDDHWSKEIDSSEEIVKGEEEGRRKRGVLDSDTDGSFAIRREENTRDWCPDKSSSIVCQDRGEEALSKHGGSSGWVVASFGEVIEEQPVHDEGRAIRRQTLRRNWRGGCRVRRRRVRSRGQT